MEDIKRVKEGLSKRKRELPGILAALESHIGMLEIVDVMPNDLARKVNLYDAQQFLDVHFPELVGREMIEPLLSINTKTRRAHTRILDLLPMFGKQEDPASECLRLQAERLKRLKRFASKSNDEVIHPFVAVVTNLQRIDPNNTKPLAKAMLAVAVKAKAETEQAIAGYNANKAL